MTPKRRALNALTKPWLLSVARHFELDVRANDSVDELRDSIAQSKKAKLGAILPEFPRDLLKDICRELEIDDGGKDKQPIVERILDKIGGVVSSEAPAPTVAESKKKPAEPTPMPKPPKESSGAPSTAPVQGELGWQSYPVVDTGAAGPDPVQAPPPPSPAPRAAAKVDLPATDSAVLGSRDSQISLGVEPRKPRLAWQGMDRKELAAPVPTQVVEIVWPGRAINRGDNLAGLDTRHVVARDYSTLPPNRLIWTNDNLVALQTLLDERDPLTHDYRYRGKVDLVYIDPPFMVNNDFLADNAIDIDLDDDVQAKKEPSLVEILAYKDTWRQGLDSFLSMLKRRLELLKQLLAPTGSIYVHLDWHSVHYVKVLMDEVFGYERFLGHIVWKRTSSKNDANRPGVIDDALLFYAQGSDWSWTPQYGPHDPTYVNKVYTLVDERGRYRLDNLTAPGVSGGVTGTEWRGVNPTTFGRHWRVPPSELERLLADHRIQLKPDGKPSINGYKQYLADTQGVALQTIWDDIPNVTQKSPGPFQVRPFTVENMGVYQRAEQWQGFQTQRSVYRDEMIKVFGGEPVTGYERLHGKKNNQWIHVGPLDGPVSVHMVWHIAREAARTAMKAVTILSADFDTLSGSEKHDIAHKTGVQVTIRVIPAHALDEVRRRIEAQRANPDQPVESMAIPAFYAPLSIVLDPRVSGRKVTLSLERCEVDIESFIASQRPALKNVTEKMTAAAKRKAEAEQAKWEARRGDLEKWLKKAATWQKFVDFWSVDWNYGRRVGPDNKPIFETDWQSFRVRRGKQEADPIVFAAEFQYPMSGHYQVAARVTDVFGNDGIATVAVDVK